MQKRFLLAPFQLGNILLPCNIFYAPLAGCSDYPFRMMSALYGKPGLLYPEMVKMDALYRNDPGTYRILDYAPQMHPIGAQLCGSKPELAGPCARILEDLGFDVIDLNCGCPVDKVTKDGSGSGLLKNPRLIGEIISNMVAAVKVPVTIKIRAGWDEEHINAVEITKIAEQAGAKAICIHGRTRKQGYRGPANWEWIRACKQAANAIKVIGNGDLMHPEDAERMFQATGCDAVLVARGTMGQPWIAEEMRRHLLRLPLIPRTPEDYRQALLHHFEITLQVHNTQRALVDMRRVGCWYLKKSAGTRAFREKISHASSLSEVRNVILNFPLGDHFLPEDPFEESCEDAC